MRANGRADERMTQYFTRRFHSHSTQCAMVLTDESKFFFNERRTKDESEAGNRSTALVKVLW